MDEARASMTNRGGFAFDKIVLLTSFSDQAFNHLPISFQRVETLNELSSTEGDILLSFGTGVVVPPDELARFKGAFNLHAASSEFPGRDPHHWAIYDGARLYGATLHVMTARVDDGPILDIEIFEVQPDDGPTTLLQRANDAGFRILARSAHRLLELEPLGITWGPNKRSRAHFLEKCQIPANLSAEEFQRRVKAFDLPGRSNLHTEMHGRRFRIEPSSK